MARRAKLTKQALADGLGISRQKVYPRLAKGMPDDNIEAAREWSNTNLDRTKGGKREPQDADVTRMRLRKLEADARQAELALELANRSLVSRQVVEAAIFEAARRERDSWLGWVAQQAPVIASELGTAPDKVFAILSKAVKVHLSELSGSPLKVVP